MDYDRRIYDLLVNLGLSGKWSDLLTNVNTLVNLLTGIASTLTLFFMAWLFWKFLNSMIKLFYR